MILERIYDDRLSQAGYLIACERARVALVVDPNRNIGAYQAAAARANARVVAVTETHIHADFVSGARELAQLTGAQLHLSSMGGSDWKYEFATDAGAELLTDGSHFMVGDVRIEAVHTPGHTPEHMCFLITDTASASEPMGAITGDFIFVGDVGRPDLLERAAGVEGTMETGARQLFQSLQAFSRYPDYLQIWPGHGAGSACGKALGAMPQSTLGYEKLFNWALAESDEQRFVEHVLAGQPEPPAYFAVMKMMNRDGPRLDPPAVPGEAGADALSHALRNGAMVVDTRPIAEFAERHAKGSINIPRNKSFLNWSGALMPYDRDVWIIGATDEKSRRELAIELSLIGIGRIAGVFPAGSIASFTGVEMQSVGHIDTDHLVADKGIAILDVRGRSEHAAGHIPGAINIPLAELQRRLDEVPKGNLAVHCQGESRSAMAASILQLSGRRDVVTMTGGFAEWERRRMPVDAPPS